MSRMDSVRKAAKMAGIGAGVGAVGATAGSLYAGDDLGTALKKGVMTGVGAAVGMGAGALKPALGGMADSYKSASRAMGPGSAFHKANQLERLGARAGLMAEDFGRLTGKSSKAIYGGAAIGALGGLGYATLKSNKPVAANKQSYDERLKFEQQRKRMLVDENIRQAKQMRSGS